MDDLLIKIFFTLFGLYSALLTWLLKLAWNKIEANAKEITDHKLCSGQDIDHLLERISDMIDTKLDAWWNRVELGLVNDGRVPPKRPGKKDPN